MKRMLFVYNPNSGMGLLKPKLSDVIDTFVKGGYEVTVYPTQRSQDAVRKVSEYKEEYDLVACSGGDGTLDEVVTGMMMRENKTPKMCIRDSIPAYGISTTSTMTSVME